MLSTANVQAMCVVHMPSSFMMTPVAEGLAHSLLIVQLSFTLYHALETMMPERPTHVLQAPLQIASPLEFQLSPALRTTPHQKQITISLPESISLLKLPARMSEYALSLAF